VALCRAKRVGSALRLAVRAWPVYPNKRPHMKTGRGEMPPARKFNQTDLHIDDIVANGGLDHMKIKAVGGTDFVFNS
jgi:hypothetical protein